MLIKKGQIIEGVEAVALRNALRMSSSVSAQELSRNLSVSLFEAQGLFDRLVSAGFVEIEKDGLPVRAGRQPAYCLTPTGAALTMARVGKPMKREKAETLLKEVLARAREANSNEDCPEFVAGIAVFGSFLSDARLLGDLDLAVAVGPKGKHDPERALRFADAYWPSGKIFLERLFYPRVWLFRQLKNRSAFISIHEYIDPLKIGAEALEVFASKWDSEAGLAVETSPGDWRRRAQALFPVS